MQTTYANLYFKNIESSPPLFSLLGISQMKNSILKGYLYSMSKLKTKVKMINGRMEVSILLKIRNEKKLFAT